MISRRTWLSLAIGAIAAPAAGPAVARRRFRLSGRGIGRGAGHTGPVMSREELRFCVNHDGRLENLEQAISELEGAAASGRLQLEASERALADAKAGVDVYSEQSVDGFNRLVDRHAELVDRYNARLPLVNEKIAERNEAVHTYNTVCAEKAYYEDDLAAITAERK